MHVGMSQAYTASSVCVQLIYNPQEKTELQISPTNLPYRGIVTRRHVVNSQEQAGLSQPWVPHAPSSWPRPWGPGHPWVDSAEVSLVARCMASWECSPT